MKKKMKKGKKKIVIGINNIKKIYDKAAKKNKIYPHELVIRVAPQEVTPTLGQLVEPMKEGKKMALTPTWISSAQLIKIVQRTPAEHVYTRPGKGGNKFSYITGNYIIKVLNFVFGWNWDFDVVEHGIQGNQVWVKGKLTVKSTKGEEISKTQFGRADIKFSRNSKEMLDFGNDLKGATTDAMKKCASLFGIASDIYGKMEYKQEANVEVKDQSVASVIEDQQTKYEKVEEAIVCSNCDGIMTQAESDFSNRIYQKTVCRECQKELKRIK